MVRNFAPRRQIGLGPQSAFWLLPLLLAAVLVLVHRFPALNRVLDLAHYLPLHSFMEGTAALAAGLIFGVGWHSYDRERQCSISLLACAFFAIGLLDFGHMMSFPGMPDFVTPSGTAKTIHFWLASKAVLGVALVAVAAMPGRFTCSRGGTWLLMAASLAVVVCTYWTVLIRPHWLPEVFVPGQGLTSFKVRAEYFVIALHLLAMALLLLRANKWTNSRNDRLLVVGISVLALSEWSFTRYSSVADIYNLLGHVYKLVGYVFIYRAVFVGCVREPFVRIRRSERQAQQERALKKATLHSIGDAVITFDVEGNIDYLNPAAEKMLGMTLEEASGTPFSMAVNLVNETDHAPASAPLQQAEPGAPAAGMLNQFMLVRRDGTEIPVEDSAAPIVDDAGRSVGAVVVLKDMTERRRAQTALRRSERMFHDLLEFAPDAIILSNAEGRILMVNAQAEKLFGYSGGEMVGQPVEILVPEQLRHDHRQRRASYADQPHPRLMGTEMDIYCRRKDGTQFPGDISLGPLQTSQGRLVMSVVRDMTARRMQEAQLREAARYARSLIEASLDPLLTISVDGRISDVNRATEEATGVPREKMVGTDFASYFTEPERAREGYKHAFWEGSVRDWPLTICHVSGGTVDVLYNAAIYRNEAGEVQGIFAAARDVTERNRFEQQLTFQATHDALTGLPNRILFQDRLQQALAQSRRNGQGVGVLFIDLDNFKQVNDTLGHAVGDALLRVVAARIRDMLRESDTVARFGGDEFVILLHEGVRLHDLDSVARKIIDSLAVPCEIDHHRLYATASIGISVAPLDGEDAETLVRNADTAMYVAKAGGRNSYCFFSAQMDSGLREKMDLSNHLRQALKNGEFELHYQPKAELKTGAMVGVEALLRWNNPTLGRVSPARFIPVAEECGLINAIGLWVLQETCRQIREWLDMGLKPVRVAINLSAAQCRNDEILHQVRESLEHHSLSGDALELEVTESMMMHDIEYAIRMFWEFRKLGVHVAMDDFGTGYSSLSYIKRLPVGRLKIDKSFVDDIDTDQNNVEIIRAIIAMAHSLDLRVVAEGVETESQQLMLRNSGCDEMQGYYFSKPLPPAEMAIFMRDVRSPELNA